MHQNQFIIVNCIQCCVITQYLLDKQCLKEYVMPDGKALVSQ